MALDFSSFNYFFPLIDKDEATELIAIAKASADSKDIFLLAGSSATGLADKLGASPTILLTRFQGSLTGKALEVANIIKPVDPAHPTPEEEVIVLGGLRLFYSAWPDAKLGALQWIVQQVSDSGKPDVYATLDAISKLSVGDITAMVDTQFFQELARYYLVMAGRYIATDLEQYELTGRVLDHGNGNPKGGVKVTIQDKNYTPPRFYGSAFTNDQGYFRSTLPIIKDAATDYSLDLVFIHPQITGSVTKTTTYHKDLPAEVYEFSLSFNPLVSTSQVVTSGSIPADVRAYLTAQGLVVNRLEDIRRLGGFINLPGDSIDKSNPNLLKLDGLASLEIVSSNTTKNNALYGRGFTSISRIANTSRKDFVAKNTDILSDYGAAQVHYQARAAHLYALSN